MIWLIISIPAWWRQNERQTHNGKTDQGIRSGVGWRRASCWNAGGSSNWSRQPFQNIECFPRKGLFIARLRRWFLCSAQNPSELAFHYPSAAVCTYNQVRGGMWPKAFKDGTLRDWTLTSLAHGMINLDRLAQTKHPSWELWVQNEGSERTDGESWVAVRATLRALQVELLQRMPMDIRLANEVVARTRLKWRWKGTDRAALIVSDHSQPNLSVQGWWFWENQQVGVLKVTVDHQVIQGVESPSLLQIILQSGSSFVLGHFVFERGICLLGDGITDYSHYIF